MEKINSMEKQSFSVLFENYQKVHPYEDSDSSEDEVDWQDTRDDPYRPGILLASPGPGWRIRKASFFQGAFVIFHSSLNHIW